MFYIRLSMCELVNACIQDSIDLPYLRYLLMDFCQTFVIDTSWDRHELIMVLEA